MKVTWLADLKSITLFCHILVDFCYKTKLKKFAVGSVERLLKMGDVVLKWLPELQASIKSLPALEKNDIQYIKMVFF